MASIGSASATYDYMANVSPRETMPVPVPKVRVLDLEQASRIALDVANTLKTDFAANLGKELKTPLDTIAGLTRCLGSHDQRRLSDTEIVDYARLIEDCARRLASFLAGVVDLATLEGAASPLKSRKLRLDGLLMSVIAAREDAAAEAGVRLVSEVAGELPIVRGDAAKLRQAIGHVLDHAIADSPADAGVSVAVSASARDGVALKIKHSGNGLTADELALVRKPLGHLDSSRTHWRDSALLNLRVAKAVIELHGGRLAIASVEGQWTEVRVVLPSA